MKLCYRQVGWLFALMVCGTTALPGCSDDGLARRYSVSGMVTYKGQPLEKGMISFVSAAPDGRSATGLIKQGYYTLTTQDPDDGAFPGQYSVTITSKTPDFAEAGEKAKKKGNTAAYIPQDFTSEANKKAPNAVPAKYSIVETSGLKADVKAQTNKDVNFALVD